MHISVACVLGHLKEELAWATDKWLWFINTTVLLKTIVPLRIQLFYFKTTLYFKTIFSLTG